MRRMVDEREYGNAKTHEGRWPLATVTLHTRSSCFPWVMHCVQDINLFNTWFSFYRQGNWGSEGSYVLERVCVRAENLPYVDPFHKPRPPCPQAVMTVLTGSRNGRWLASVPMFSEANTILCLPPLSKLFSSHLPFIHQTRVSSIFYPTGS